MALDIDQRLARFDDSDVTVVLCNALLQALPFVRPVPTAVSLQQVMDTIASEPRPSALAHARDRATGEAGRTSLWIATGMDAGDGVVPVVSSVRTALALYLARRCGRERRLAEGLAYPYAGDNPRRSLYEQLSGEARSKGLGIYAADLTESVQLPVLPDAPLSDE